MNKLTKEKKKKKKDQQQQRTKEEKEQQQQKTQLLCVDWKNEMDKNIKNVLCG